MNEMEEASKSLPEGFKIEWSGMSYQEKYRRGGARRLCAGAHLRVPDPGGTM